jgi:hypothetical protein
MADDVSDYGLGRLKASDERDRRYAMRATVFEQPERIPPKPRKRPYNLGPTLDQGRTSQCVGYSSRDKLASAPFMVKTGVGLTPYEIYQGAQERDEWPGENYEGTSVRGAFKFLQETKYIKSYVWAQGVTDGEQFIRGGYGTIIVGTIWKNSMFRPKWDGFLQVDRRGSDAGGHAYHWFWCVPEKREAWFKNSWGAAFGITLNNRPGCFKLSYDDLDWLLAEDGEAGAGIEVKVK